MSSAQEEADDGPRYNESDEELERSSKTGKSRSNLHHDRKEIPIRPREAHKGDDEAEEEEDSLTVNGHASSDDDIDLRTDNTECKVLIRASPPEIGRPSSADGSLSIPDDTPSHQVYRRRILRVPI